MTKRRIKAKDSRGGYREGSGKPPIYGEKLKKMSFTLLLSQSEFIREQSIKLDCSKAEIVRQLIDEYMKKG